MRRAKVNDNTRNQHGFPPLPVPRRKKHLAGAEAGPQVAARGSGSVLDPRWEVTSVL